MYFSIFHVAALVSGVRLVAVALSYCTAFDGNTDGSTIFELFFYRANKLVIKIRYRLDTKV
jgi:hypothetical protein